MKNDVLVIVDDKAKHVFVNGVKLALVRAVDLVGMGPMQRPSVRIEFDFESYKTVNREYGMPLDDQAKQYFAPPGEKTMTDCAAKFTGTQNFGGFPDFGPTRIEIAVNNKTEIDLMHALDELTRSFGELEPDALARVAAWFNAKWGKK